MTPTPSAKRKAADDDRQKDDNARKRNAHQQDSLNGTITSNNLTECEQEVLKGGENAKDWSLAICNDIYAKPSVCGKFVRCGACGISGRTQGVINMRHPYAVGNWNSHCTSDVHSNVVANFEAEKKIASLNSKKQK